MDLSTQCFNAPVIQAFPNLAPGAFVFFILLVVPEAIYEEREPELGPEGKPTPSISRTISQTFMEILLFLTVLGFIIPWSVVCLRDPGQIAFLCVCGGLLVILTVTQGAHTRSELNLRLRRQEEIIRRGAEKKLRMQLSRYFAGDEGFYVNVAADVQGPDDERTTRRNKTDPYRLKEPDDDNPDYTHKPTEDPNEFYPLKANTGQREIIVKDTFYDEKSGGVCRWCCGDHWFERKTQRLLRGFHSALTIILILTLIAIMLYLTFIMPGVLNDAFPALSNSEAPVWRNIGMFSLSAFYALWLTWRIARRPWDSKTSTHERALVMVICFFFAFGEFRALCEGGLTCPP